MKKVLLFLSLLFFVNLGMASAAKRIIPPIKNIEWWETVEECRDAKYFVYYLPRTKSTTPMPELIQGGLPHRACVEMPLPEIGRKSAWVRQAEGDPYLFERKEDSSLVPVFRAECKNKALSVVYLPDPQGPKGDKGDSGSPGASIKGDKGDKGDSGSPGASIKGDKGDKGDSGENAVLPPKKHHKKLVAVLIGAGAAAVVVAAVLLRGNESPHKDPVTIIRTGP